MGPLLRIPTNVAPRLKTPLRCPRRWLSRSAGRIVGGSHALDHRSLPDGSEDLLRRVAVRNPQVALEDRRGMA
jgi:hypothetical protein